LTTGDGIQFDDHELPMNFCYDSYTKRFTPRGNQRATEQPDGSGLDQVAPATDFSFMVNLHKLVTSQKSQC